MKRRGQAALEYLVTYGWGFIAILIVIGALAYFGVLSPTKYLPQRCDLGAQLVCTDFVLEEGGSTGPIGWNGKVHLLLRNNFGDDINVSRVWVADDVKLAKTGYVIDPKTGTTATLSDTRHALIAQGNVSNEFISEIPVASATFLSEGERITLPIIVEFRRDVPGAPIHNVTGSIFATVHASS